MTVPPDVTGFLMLKYALPAAQRLRVDFGLTVSPLVAFWMPIRIEAKHFSLLPDGVRPRKADWHFVLAARFGRQDQADLGIPLDAQHAMFGEHVLDLIACSPDLLTVRARHLGLGAVLGYPPEGWMAGDDPVRVHATPLGWLRGGCQGVVLVGDTLDEQAWLRECTPGVVADSVAHGEALLTKMKRQLPALPPVMVAA